MPNMSPRRSAALLGTALAGALACTHDATAPVARVDPAVPHVSLYELAPSDTLWQRSLLLSAIQSGGTRPIVSLALVVDVGTSAQHVDALAPHDGVPLVTLWLDTTLVGRHTITVRATDDSGHVNDTTFTRVFVTPDAPYTVTALPGLGGETIANDVNSRGVAAGWSVTADSLAHPVVWEGGVLRQLPTAGGEPARAIHVNEGGDVLGESMLWSQDSTNYGLHPRVWRADGSVIPLGPIAAPVRLETYTGDSITVTYTCCTRAGDLNDRGQAVGFTDGGLVALLDLAGGGFVTLGSGFYEFGLNSVNDQGQAAGYYYFDEYQSAPLVLAAPGAARVRLAEPTRMPPTLLACRHSCFVGAVRVGDAGEALVSSSGFRRDGVEEYPVFTFPDGRAVELTQMFGPDIVSPRMSRRGMLVSAIDGRDSTLWLWRGAEGRTVRVAAPDGWKFVSVGGVAPNGVLTAQARNVATGWSGAVLLTPSAR